MRKSDQTKILSSLKKELTLWRMNKRSSTEKLPIEMIKKLKKLDGVLTPSEISRLINLSNSTINKYFSMKQSSIKEKIDINADFIEISSDLIKTPSLEMILLKSEKRLEIKGDLNADFFSKCLDWLTN